MKLRLKEAEDEWAMKVDVKCHQLIVDKEGNTKSSVFWYLVDCYLLAERLAAGAICKGKYKSSQSFFKLQDTTFFCIWM